MPSPSPTTCQAVIAESTKRSKPWRAWRAWSARAEAFSWAGRGAAAHSRAAGKNRAVMRARVVMGTSVRSGSGRKNVRLRCLGSHRYFTHRSDPELNGVEVQVFGIRKSPATRSALRFFAERRVKTHFVDLMERAASKGEHARFVQRHGIAALVDRDSRRSR